MPKRSKLIGLYVAGVLIGLAAFLAVSARAQSKAQNLAGNVPDPKRTKVGATYPPLGAGPFTFDTAEQHKIRVVIEAKGLSHPWSLAFLPNGDMLVTERPGHLKIIRKGAAEAQPLTGLPPLGTSGRLFDVVLHPRFAENRLVYFTYSKPIENGMFSTTLARARLADSGFTDVQDLFQCEPIMRGPGSRIAFDGKGHIYMTTSDAYGDLAQSPQSDYGKMLRLDEDGKPAKDNPFVGKKKYKPEIYTLGHRDQSGITINAAAGAVYSDEHGPQGGDEVNAILPGRNYGWPLVSYGRTYPGPRVSPLASLKGMEEPLVVWIPDIAPGGMTFYTGDRFPAWKGNMFVGGMSQSEIPGTGRLQRIVFNGNMEEIRRESLLTELHQRIRDVHQGPDGFLYLLTDEDDAVVLRIEPAP